MKKIYTSGLVALALTANVQAGTHSPQDDTTAHDASHHASQRVSEIIHRLAAHEQHLTHATHDPKAGRLLGFVKQCLTTLKSTHPHSPAPSTQNPLADLETPTSRYIAQTLP